MVRAVPDMVAHPYPIGYDVINYYIPVITNFQEHWPIVTEQFPLYVLILHFIQIGTDLQPQSLVSTSAVILYGFFSVSLFLVSRKLLGLSEVYSVYLTLFVIFQLPVLRTAWDLHKDIFSLTLLFFSISVFLQSRTNIGRFCKISSSITASIAVLVDKMVGGLFVVSLLIYAFSIRTKYVAFLSLLIAGTFAVALASDYGSLRQPLQMATGRVDLNLSDPHPNPYSSENLLMLFAVVNGPLLVPAGFGFLQSDNLLLKIVLAITAIGSFSWIVFPDSQTLAPDRWIFLFGIFLSIFASYGIIKYSQTKIHPRYRTQILCSILGLSAALGLLYATMPYQFASISENMLGHYIKPFGPMSMQFNSIAVSDTGELLKTISWINENSPKNATLTGENHWRGWMEIKLQDNRTFVYNSNQYRILEFSQDCHLDYCYLVTSSSESLHYLRGKARIHEVYQNKLFTIYKIGSINGLQS
jgi:hypothetical protein